MTRREAREEAFFIIFEHSFSGEQVDDIIANAVEGRSLQIKPGLPIHWQKTPLKR